MSLALAHRSISDSNSASWQLADVCVCARGPVTVTLRPTEGTVASLAAGGHWPMPSGSGVQRARDQRERERKREREVRGFVNGRRSRAVSVQSGVLSLTTLSQTSIPPLCVCPMSVLVSLASCILREYNPRSDLISRHGKFQQGTVGGLSDRSGLCV